MVHYCPGTGQGSTAFGPHKGSGSEYPSRPFGIYKKLLPAEFTKPVKYYGGPFGRITIFMGIQGNGGDTGYTEIEFRNGVFQLFKEGEYEAAETGIDMERQVAAACDLCNLCDRVNHPVGEAGGRTGDALVYLAYQLKNTQAEIVYIDLSTASMEITKQRIRHYGLEHKITWISDSRPLGPTNRLEKTFRRSIS